MSARAWLLMILWPATIWVLGVTLANTVTWLEQRRRARGRG